MSKKIVYSKHHFMFAFRWDYLQKNRTIKDLSFDERTNFNEFDRLLKKNNAWKRSNNLNYKDFNHFTYFYQFVRNSVYDTGNDKDIVRYYEYEINKEKNKKYCISYLTDDFKKDVYYKENTDKAKYFKEHTEKLELEVDGITLFIFNTGVGVVSFDLSNTKKSQSTPEKVLKINEFGRRVYPQFLNFNEQNKDFVFNTQRVFLATSIKLFDWEETFDYYKNIKENFKTNKPINLPNFISKLFSDAFFVETETKQDYERIRIKLVTDDRMFFVSWYGNDEYSKYIGRNYTDNSWWYAYIFGDKSTPSIANKEMMIQQIEQHTYQRWSRYGTLYGMSRDTFVCISPSEKSMTANDLPNLKEHQSTIYYQIAVLCLIQRATVLRFSAEVANIANVAKKDNADIRIKIEKLYANYIEFLNKIYFREVTSQIQGIEIYKKFQKVMNIQNDVNDLDNELDELNRYAELLHQKEETKISNKHTLLATIFLPAMLISGIFGMNIFTKDGVNIPFQVINPYYQPTFYFWLASLIMIFIIGYFIFYKNKKTIIIWLGIFFWASLLFTIIYKLFKPII